MADSENFLARWSRRKQAVAQAEALPDPAPAPSSMPEETALPASAAEPEADAAAPPVRHPAEEVDIETLGKESDYTVFLQQGVPADLRRQALRKLWTSDPVLANLDGLNDYYDEANPAYGFKLGAKTAWRIGRGFLTDAELGLEPKEDDEALASAPDLDAESSPESVAAAAEEPDPQRDESEAERPDTREG